MATIKGFHPPIGVTGTRVEIYGTGFTGTSSVKFNNVAATFSVDSDTKITATVPNTASSGPITVGVVASPTSFKLVAAASQISITPTSGKHRDLITINALAGCPDFIVDDRTTSGTPTKDTDTVNIVTSVSVGGAMATFDVKSPSQIVFRVPPDARTGPIVVTKLVDELSSSPPVGESVRTAADFTYQGPPEPFRRAFPDAIGWGAYSRGGRGPDTWAGHATGPADRRTYIVSSLADPLLKTAMTASGPGTIDVDEEGTDPGLTPFNIVISLPGGADDGNPETMTVTLRQPGAGVGGTTRYTIGTRGDTGTHPSHAAGSVVGIPGTYRYAILDGSRQEQAKGPRYVVFTTGGTIMAHAFMKVVHPYCTIAGQTAPGGGICIRADPNKNNDGCEQHMAHNIVVSNLRWRFGAFLVPPPGGDQTKGCKAHSMDIRNAGGDAHANYVHYCSISWGYDMNTMTGAGGDEATYDHVLIAECLNNPPNTAQPNHSRGINHRAAPEYTGHFTDYKNVMTQHQYRTPMLSSCFTTEVVCCIVHHNQEFGMNANADAHGVTNDPNFRYENNYFKLCPQMPGSHAENEVADGYGPWCIIYTKGIIGPSRLTEAASETNAQGQVVYVYSQDRAKKNGLGDDVWQQGNPYVCPESPFPITDKPSATQNYAELVTAYSASNPTVGAGRGVNASAQPIANPDLVDQQAMNNIKLNKDAKGTVGGNNLINTPAESHSGAGYAADGFPILAAGTAPADADQDGVPDVWWSTQGFTQGNHPNALADAGDGYLWIDHYIWELAGATFDENTVKTIPANTATNTNLARPILPKKSIRRITETDLARVITPFKSGGTPDQFVTVSRTLETESAQLLVKQQRTALSDVVAVFIPASTANLVEEADVAQAITPVQGDFSYRTISSDSLAVASTGYTILSVVTLPGRWLVLDVASWKGGAGAPIDPSVSGLGYTWVMARSRGQADRKVSRWYAWTGGGGSGNLNITFGAEVQLGIQYVLYELIGAHVTDPFAQHVDANVFAGPQLTIPMGTFNNPQDRPLAVFFKNKVDDYIEEVGYVTIGEIGADSFAILTTVHLSQPDESPSASWPVNSNAQGIASEVRLQGTGNASEITKITDLQLAQIIAAVRAYATVRAAETEAAQVMTRVRSRVLGRSIETSLSRPVVKLKNKGLAQALESEASQTIRPVKSRALIQVTETNTSFAITKSVKTRVVAQKLESDLAQTVRPIRVRSFGRASETDTAQVIAAIRTKLVVVGRVTETSTAQVLTRSKTKNLAQPIETNLSRVLTHPKVKALGLITETNLSQALVESKTKAIGRGGETDLSRLISPGGSFPIGVAAENDSAQVMAVNPIRRLLGVATETNVAQATGHVRSFLVNRATETDTTAPFTKALAKPVARPLETNAAFAIRPRKTRAVGQVPETEAAQAVTRLKIRLVVRVVNDNVAPTLRSVRSKTLNQPTETDVGRAFAHPKIVVVNRAFEIETPGTFLGPKFVTVKKVLDTQVGQPIAEVKTKAIGRVSETNTAQPVSTFTTKVVVVGRATETNTARILTKASAKAVGRAIESDSSYTLSHAKVKLFNRATSVDNAIHVGTGFAILLGRASESNSSFLFRHGKVKTVLGAQEIDLSKLSRRLPLIGRASETDAASTIDQFRLPGEVVHFTASYKPIIRFTVTFVPEVVLL